MTTKYDHEVEHHNPQEGFDHSELDARKITLFVIISVVTLVVTILALRSLSNWRLNHYEYADPSKTRVRIPFERAKELFLAEEAAGKTFYPAKPTEPKPEEPAVAAPGQPQAGTAPEAGKQPEAVKK